MKTLRCIGICLLLTGNVVATLWPPGHEPKPLTEEEIISRKEDFKNPEKLKAFLMDWFVEIDHSGALDRPLQIRGFKDFYEIKDTTIRSVLLDICRDSAQKTGWKYGDNWQAEFRLHSSIFWMGVFADESAKKLLLAIAKDNAKDVFCRYPAIFGYIYCADVQEVRDLFVWFLENRKQFPTNLRVALVDQIQRLWNGVETDEQKREAIIASLCVVVAQEKDAWTFGSLDSFLSGASKEYATSRQRVELLKKNGKKSLADSISKSQQNVGKPLTNISTSLKELKARDFSKPPENKP